jgi:phosphoribosylanthranilate isomerase
MKFPIVQPYRTRIKICGITSVDDARLAVELGADAIGLVFYPPSARYVSVEQAAECAAVVPPFVSVVALFVNESAQAINRVLEAMPVSVLQFHGDETEQFCASFNRPYIKALRVKHDVDAPAAAKGFERATGILLDSWHPDSPGGTGKVFDWQQARGRFPCPLILAGGLNSENVASAIEQLRPSAVDVSSGVESEPGVKDPVKLQNFIAAVHAADQQLGGDRND